MKKQTCKNCKWFKKENISTTEDTFGLLENGERYTGFKIVRNDGCVRFPKWEIKKENTEACGEFKLKNK